MMMAVRNPRQQLIQKTLENGHVQTRVANIKVFFQVLIEKLEYQRQLPFRVHNIVQSNNVGVLEFFQQRNFSNGRRGYALVLCLETNLFESNNFTRDAVLALVDNAVRALADLFHFLIALHGDA